MMFLIPLIPSPSEMITHKVSEKFRKILKFKLYYVEYSKTRRQTLYIPER